MAWKGWQSTASIIPSFFLMRHRESVVPYSEKVEQQFPNMGATQCLIKRVEELEAQIKTLMSKKQ